MTSMRRTTIYLPDEMKAAIERAAVSRGVTEAEVIREAITALLGDTRSRRVQIPVFPDGLGEEIGTRVDELLENLGEDDPSIGDL